MAANPRAQMRQLVIGIVGFMLLGGWVFILSQNNFRLTPPVVFVCLGYLAVVLMIFNLWRTGAAMFQPDDASTWTKPAGVRGELEKEKRTLLKAIKEAEFDQAMGKLSKADAEQLIKTYRVRAIEVIKDIDRLDAGQAGTVRERIAREVKARLELAEKAKKPKAEKTAKPKPDETVKADGETVKTDSETVKVGASKEAAS